MKSAFSLGVTLFILWFLFSGHTEPLLLILGGISAALSVFVARRMDAVDHEGHPVHIAGRGVFYWFWLAKEILISSIKVSYMILHPRMPISPNVIRIKASQKDELGQVVYANSITLTPGTVTIALDQDGILDVHAISRKMSDDVKNGEMNRKVCKLMGDL